MADRTISVELRALTDRYRRDMAQAGTATRQTGVHAAGTTRAMGGMAGAAKRLIPILGVAGLARSASQAVRQSVDLESSLTKMETLVGLTSTEVGTLSAGFGDLTDKTGIANQELADAAFFISSAGLRGSEALDALEASATAAAIGLGDTRVVADLVTSAMNAYGDETLTASSATDILVGAVRAGKAEAPELASAMGQVLPIASEMGVSFDEVGAAVAAMTRTGTDAGSATTQLRGILMALLRPSEQAEEALREFGLSGETMRQTLQEQGLLATLELLTGTFDGNQEALARVIPRAEGLMGVMDLMGANVEDTRQIFADMTDTTGLSADALERYQETTEFQLNRASGNWDEFKTNVADEVLPAVNWALEDINKTMDAGLLTSTSNMLSAPFSWLDDFAEGLWGLTPPADEASDAIIRARETTAELGDHMDRMPKTAADAADGFEDVKIALDDVGEAALTADERLQGYMDTLRAATDPVFALNKAVQDVDEAQSNYNATLEDSEATQADVEQAAFDLAVAVAGLEQAALDGDLSFNEFEGQLDRWVDQGRITAGEADVIRGRVEDLTEASEGYHGEYVATLIAQDDASGVVDALIAKLGRVHGTHAARLTLQAEAYTSGSHPSQTSSTTSGTMRRRASGGPVGPGRPYLVGEDGPELVTFGQSGMVHDAATTAQSILSRQQVAHLGDAFSAGRTRSGGPSFSVQQTFAADVSRSTLAEARHQQRLAFLEAV